MNTYLCPVYSHVDNDCYIECILATNYSSAEEKIRRAYDEDNEYDLLDWDEFRDEIQNNKHIFIGDLYDSEGFSQTIV